MLCICLCYIIFESMLQIRFFFEFCYKMKKLQAFADDETRETIDLMHRMTRTATTHTASPVRDPSLIYVSDISHPEEMNRDILDNEAIDDAAISTIENKPELLLQQSKYPALNQMLGVLA